MTQSNLKFTDPRFMIRDLSFKIFLSMKLENILSLKAELFWVMKLEPGLSERLGLKCSRVVSKHSSYR